MKNTKIKIVPNALKRFNILDKDFVIWFSVELDALLFASFITANVKYYVRNPTFFVKKIKIYNR
jgi:hypothetical protein